MESTDLQSAVQFVTQRISNQARYSGSPLDDNEQRLLAELPKHPAVPLWRDPDHPGLVPRDMPFERLCDLAKAAIKSDSDSGAAMNWLLAATVLKLHQHPMYWLLQWAGFRVKNPFWDRVLLWCVGILLVGSLISYIVVTDFETEPSLVLWIAGVSSLLVLVVVIGFSHSLEKWQLRRTIQSYKETMKQSPFTSA